MIGCVMRVKNTAQEQTVKILLLNTTKDQIYRAKAAKQRSSSGVHAPCDKLLRWGQSKGAEGGTKQGRK